MVALCAGAAHAWPADVYVDLEPGREVFRRLAAVEWVEVEDPSVATAELLSSGELLFSGHKPGRTLVLLYAEGKFAVWRLRVGPKGENVTPAKVDPASMVKACPGAKVGEKLVVSVRDERCRAALIRYLEGDAFSARDLELTFELQALQAQLAAMQKRLEEAGLGAVRLRYLGAGLNVDGELTRKEHRSVLWNLFRESAGRVPLDDESRLRED